MAFVPSHFDCVAISHMQRRRWAGKICIISTGPRPSTRGCYKKQTPVCLAEKRVPRNGGVNNRVDWTDYDPEKLEREVAEAEYMMKHHPIVHTVSPWTILMGTDMIQHENNIVEARRQYDLPVEWDPSRLIIQRMSDVTAVREIQGNHKSIWQVIVDEIPIAVSLEPEGEGPLCFLGSDEANRFAEQITAEGGLEAKAVEVDTMDVRKACDEENRLIPFVPSGTLVTPTMLGGV